MTIKIPYVNLKKQSNEENSKIVNALKKILSESNFILGDETKKFEKNICKYLNVNYCVALNSGTDALTLALSLVGVKRGDEVITASNSFIASVASIAHLGAKPVFSDALEDYNIDPKDIKKKINNKTKAIMPVHLTGKSCNMDEIKKISKDYNIPIIEDAAQAIGTKFKNRFVGTFGEIGCFSAHPLKNLNAIGDAGYLVTNKKKFYKKALLLRNHGMENRNTIKLFGHVSRMDNFQAAVLNIRLKSLNKVIKKRRQNAKLYEKYLKNINDVKLPSDGKNNYSTFHTFLITAKKRDELRKFLLKKGISTAIHYPYLIHKLKFIKKYNHLKYNLPIAEKMVKQILTLPINQYMTKSEIKYISENIIKFYKGN
tara:strand:+ start:311 stop:1423 length:1113 start_codon:yes stop_codon:yes gene_type:complete